MYLKPNNIIVKEQEEKQSKYWNDVLVQASIAAMQGIQEMGGIAGEALEIAPCTIIARKAFDIAEAMVEEYEKLKES